MNATDGSERLLPELPEDERVAIARQVAEAMDIRYTEGAQTRISGCQGCGQCLSNSVVTASSARSIGSAAISEAELVQLVQEVVQEVLQELRARSVSRTPFQG